MASISFEIDVDVSGYIHPAERMTRDYPGCDAFVEDIEITGLGEIVHGRDALGMSNWTTKDLLAGVDVKNPEIQKLFANIIAAKEAEIVEAILDAEDAWPRRAAGSFHRVSL